jgi:hypothetical protein
VSQSAADLMCHFESLGRNCEFGFVQRLLGADPMGLLRFAGMSFDALVQALNTRFAGIAEPGNFRVWLDRNEYRITVESLGLGYHTQLHEGEISKELLYKIEYRKTRFLISQLIDDLENQRKIFVYHQQNAMPAQNLRALLRALGGYGAVTLLWVVEADVGHPAGSVRKINDRLMLGHVEKLAPSDSVHQPHLPSWLALCRKAYALWTSDKAARVEESSQCNGTGAPPRIIDISFGAAGTATQYQVQGWSEPEADYTWTTGTETLLKLPRTNNLDLMLGLQIFPYVNPMHIVAQRLTVIVNGVDIARFIVKNPSYLQCPISRATLERQEFVEVTFHHPDAIRPSAHPSYNSDSRELAFAFQRISLHWA